MYKIFNKLLFIIPLILIFAIVPIFYFFKPIIIEQFFFDITHNNEESINYLSSSNTLKTYPKINFENLPPSLQNKMISNQINYINILNNLEFYEIPKKDLYKKIFLNNRIYNLISKEQIPKSIWFSTSKYFYFSIENKILKVAFDLIEILNKKGYDASEIKINSAYRSPSHNDYVKGARNSMHLYGKALDIQIGDINRDNKINLADKNIVYEILNNNLIINKGGLGFYPRTMILHFDIRGKRARWDNYRRE